jgi:hypothetical protein
MATKRRVKLSGCKLFCGKGRLPGTIKRRGKTSHCKFGRSKVKPHRCLKNKRARRN